MRYLIFFLVLHVLCFTVKWRMNKRTELKTWEPGEREKPDRQTLLMLHLALFFTDLISTFRAPVSERNTIRCKDFVVYRNHDTLLKLFFQFSYCSCGFSFHLGDKKLENLTFDRYVQEFKHLWCTQGLPNFISTKSNLLICKALMPTFYLKNSTNVWQRTL